MGWSFSLGFLTCRVRKYFLLRKIHHNFALVLSIQIQDYKRFYLIFQCYLYISSSQCWDSWFSITWRNYRIRISHLYFFIPNNTHFRFRLTKSTYLNTIWLLKFISKFFLLLGLYPSNLQSNYCFFKSHFE